MLKLHLSFARLRAATSPRTSRLILAALASACARHATPAGASQFSTAPPPSSCAYVGRASGSATEATAATGLARARDNLAGDADRLSGTYIQVTGQDITKVEMALDAYQVRLEARIYRCAEPGDAESTVALVRAEDAGAVLAVDLGDGGERPGAASLVCPPSTEPRPVDPTDGPGWQCARKVGDRWVAEGPYVLSWNSGTTRTEGSFENGKRSGQWSSYYANGQLRERAAFRDGQLEGCAEEFDANGTALPSRCARDDAGPAR